MTLLKYTVPADLVSDDDWDFRIHPGTFLFHIPPLVAVFQALVADYSRAPKGTGRHKSHPELLSLLTWLEHAAASDAWIIDWDGSQKDVVWLYASSLIFSRQFESVSCPTCEIEYSPMEGSIADWTFEEDNVEKRGRRLICPCGHVLYATTEWQCISFGALTIEEEHISSFRAALKAVADPLAAGAGEAGGIGFLNIKTFKQSYLEFCDQFAADEHYPPEARSTMRQRREALFPYLGQPLLHGGISHAGFLLNVFINKASGAVIHWESQPLPRPKKGPEPSARERAAIMKAVVSALLESEKDATPPEQ